MGHINANLFQNNFMNRAFNRHHRSDNTIITGRGNDNVVTHGGRVSTGAGNDNIYVLPNSGKTNINSGSGNDHIFVGPNAGETNINAGSGNDKIDILMTNKQGNININGGEGYDEVTITDLTSTGTDWAVDYNAESNNSSFTVNVGDNSYAVGTDVESLNIKNANGETVLNVDNVSEWLSQISGSENSETVSYEEAQGYQGALNLLKPNLPAFSAV
ncbi:MAG: hypothetical protein AB1782_07195 [Cyanobacteriota bacterium]